MPFFLPSPRSGKLSESRGVERRRSMAIAATITRKVRRMSIFTISRNTDHAPASQCNLRHCQEQYLSGATPTRKKWRLFWQHTSTTPVKAPHKEGIFVFHAANIGVSGTPRPTTGLQPGSVVRAAERSIDLEFEKKVFYNAINNARQFEGVRTVILDPAFSADVQEYADTLQPSPTRLRNSEHLNTIAPTAIEQRMFSHGRVSVRLTSPPASRALACCEHWYSGKYRRYEHGGPHVCHLTHIPPYSSQQPYASQDYLPAVFDIMIDPRWEAVGLGRTMDGRWVVEFLGAGYAENSDVLYELPAYKLSTEQDGGGMVDRQRILRRKHSSMHLAAAYAELCDGPPIPEPLLVRQETHESDSDDNDRMKRVERHRRMAMAALNGERVTQ